MLFIPGLYERRLILDDHFYHYKYYFSRVQKVGVEFTKITPYELEKAAKKIIIWYPSFADTDKKKVPHLGSRVYHDKSSPGWGWYDTGKVMSIKLCLWQQNVILKSVICGQKRASRWFLLGSRSESKKSACVYSFRVLWWHRKTAWLTKLGSEGFS